MGVAICMNGKELIEIKNYSAENAAAVIFFADTPHCSGILMSPPCHDGQGGDIRLATQIHRPESPPDLVGPPN
jgi:hypothetical protein